MKGNAQVLDLLNTLLTGELTAVHQFIAHSRLCKQWGYMRLAEKIEHESHDELGHAGGYVERLLFLGGTPDLQRLETLRIGDKVEDIFNNDLALEREAVQRLNDGIALARSVGDNGTEALLTEVLTSEEGHVLWLETQLRLVRDLGIANYLSEQIKG